MGSPTYIPQNDPHDAPIILNRPGPEQGQKFVADFRNTNFFATSDPLAPPPPPPRAMGAIFLLKQ